MPVPSFAPPPLLSFDVTLSSFSLLSLSCLHLSLGPSGSLCYLSNSYVVCLSLYQCVCVFVVCVYVCVCVCVFVVCVYVCVSVCVCVYTQREAFALGFLQAQAKSNPVAIQCSLAFSL